MIPKRLIGTAMALTGLFVTTSGIHQALATGTAQDVDWPTYLQSADRSSFSDSTLDAMHLSLKWSAQQGAITAQPVVSQGVVYWGDWGGFEHAATTAGTPLWSTFIGQTTVWPGCSPSTVGVAGAATVQNGVVYAPGGDANMYALDAGSGAILWKSKLGPYRTAFIWDSPLVYGGHVYIATSSLGDCPLVQGKFFELDAATGAKINVLNLAPDGCVGVGQWGSATLTGSQIYFATGNPGGTTSNPYGKCDKGEPLGNSVVRADLNLHVLDHWRIPRSQTVVDSDFGATPTLFDGLVGAINKNGWFYAFRQGQLAKGPVWEHRFGAPGYDLAPASFDGTRLYIASGWPLSTHGTNGRCRGALTAFAPTTGKKLWQLCLDTIPLGAPVSARGVVEVAAGDSVIIANSSDGQILYDTVFPGERFDGPASTADGELFIGGLSGTLYAIGP